MATTETDVTRFLAARREEIDRELERLLPSGDVSPARLHRAIRHSVFAGGKRVRPILCLAAGETAGAPPGRLLTPACGIEMIHTYSLIHDDLPALDDDDLRRGVPTCHVLFGEATAILAGDALLTHGLGTLARYPEGGEFAAAKIRVLETVVDAIGTRGMIGGQTDDLEAARRPEASEDLVLAIHENKTGRLIRASLAVGGLLSGATRDVLRALEDYGRAVGLAFQIKDDLLDIEADSATLGKAAGKDAAAGKKTFPAVWGIERSRAMLRDQVEKAIEAARGLPGRGGRLPELARYVEEREK